MITARVRSKGQVTIPKEVRERLGVRPGDDLGFEEKDGLLVVSKPPANSPFDKWVGRLKHLEGQRSDDLVREARGPGGAVGRLGLSPGLAQRRRDAEKKGHIHR